MFFGLELPKFTPARVIVFVHRLAVALLITTWPDDAASIRPGAPGCGFPMIKLVGLFSLSSGALLESARGNLPVHENLLFRELWKKLQKGDVLLR